MTGELGDDHQVMPTADHPRQARMPEHMLVPTSAQAHYADLLVMPTSRESPCRFGRSSHCGRHNPPALKGLPKRAAAGLRGRSHRLHRFLQGAPMADVRGDPPASRLFSSRLLVVEARSQQKRTTGARGRSLPPPLA
jgi:hypothetical protein